MSAALQEAEKALEKDEVPIGAVVVYQNKIIGRGFNQTEMLKDPTAHGEIIAITSAANYLNSKYLTDCDLYVTIEPCLMCSGAVLLSRIRTLYFGAFDPKFGACGSVFNVLESEKLNHSVKIYSGLYADEAATLLKTYFRNKRKGNRL